MKSKLFIIAGVFLALGLTVSVHAETDSANAVRANTSAEMVTRTKATNVKAVANQVKPVKASLSYKQTLRPGYTGDSVSELQAKLQSLGYYNLKIDGKYGPGTRAAVARFQAAKGLSADGIAGNNTFAAFSNTGFTLPPVNANNDGPAVCTLEYAPVCGQKTVNCVTEPCDQPQPETFGNKCQLRTSGAKYLYDGKCDTTKPVDVDEDTLSDEEKKELIEKLEKEIERLENYIKEIEEKIERIEDSL